MSRLAASAQTSAAFRNSPPSAIPFTTGSPLAQNRGDDGREGRLLVGKQQAALLDLAAAAHFHSSGAAAEAAADGDDDFELPQARPHKRCRVAPLLSSLAARLAARSSSYSPLLARLLLSNGLALPAEAYAECLGQLARLAPAHLPAHFMADEHDADAALWLLRLAHALALAWPLHLAPEGGGDGGGGGLQEGLPTAAALEEQWGVSWCTVAAALLRQELHYTDPCLYFPRQPCALCLHLVPSPCFLLPCPSPPGLQAIWSAALGYAKSANVPPASFAAALPVLATIARRRLAGQLPPGFHKLWGLPLLQQIPSPAALDFVAAAVVSGADTAVDATSWQPDVLQWLRSAAAATAPGSLVMTVAAVLRLPLDACGSSGGGSGSGSLASEDAPSLGRLPADADCSWWQWWQEDVALSAQVAGLIRGEGH